MGTSRVPSQRHAEAIGSALHATRRFAHLLGHVQFYCGVDPLFAGLHHVERTTDGRSYRDTAHVCYPFHLDRPADQRVTTVVMPGSRPLPPALIVHELGHALHHAIGFEHDAVPVSEYAATSRMEAFAEAFAAYLFWYGDQDAAQRDVATVALFDRLAVP